MPEYKISSGNVTDVNGNYIYVHDITGNIGDVTYEKDVVTNLYYPMSNTDGYVTGDRGKVVLFLDAYINTSSGKIPAKVMDYEPKLVDKWTIKHVVDGWLVLRLYAIPKVTNVSTYVIPEGVSFIYRESNRTIMKVVDGELELSNEDELFESEPTVVSDRLVVINATKRLNHIVIDKNELLLEGDCDREYTKLQRRYDELSGVLEGSIYEFYNRGNKAVAQRNIEYLNRTVYDN